MITITSKSGKKLMAISDTLDGEDSIFIDGKQISLEDAYADDNIKTKFNKTVEQIKIDDNVTPASKDDDVNK